MADGDNVVRVRDRRGIAAELGDGKGGGDTVEARVDIAVIEIEPAYATQDHRCLFGVGVGAKQVEGALVAPPCELALAGALGAMGFVEERPDRGRVSAAARASGSARGSHQRTSTSESAAADATV